MRFFGLLVAALLCMGIQGASAPTGPLAGRVVRVTDGDTVTVLDAAKAQHKIRLLDIDAPESKQAFGQKSKAYLASLIAGKDVRVESTSRDVYGRVLGTVYLGDENVNLKMVEAGFAWRYIHSKNPVYGKAQEEARAARRGLWADPHPVNPSDFRKANRKPREAPAASK